MMVWIILFFFSVEVFGEILSVDRMIIVLLMDNFIRFIELMIVLKFIGVLNS